MNFPKLEHDKNGYLTENGQPKSLVQSDLHQCYNCGKFGDLARHEIFHEDMSGNMRDRSKQYGLWLSLCPVCHGLYHSYKQIYMPTMKIAQAKAMEEYDWSIDDFRGLFGKNYL